MGLFSNYYGAGPGIPKMPQEKRGIVKFLEVYGRHFWDLLFLNMLYMLFCIPIVTIGPATAALFKVTRNYSQERSCFMFHEFWKTFKSSFKQSFVTGIVDILLIIWLPYMIAFYYNMSKVYPWAKILVVLSISLMLIIYIMHFYIYLLIVSTNLKMKQIVKNSFLLASIGMKKTLISFFSIVALLIVMLLILLSATNIGIIVDLVILCAILFSGSAFIISYNCYPIIRKYVIQPFYDSKGEKNPEFDYLRPATGDDAIFEDKGGKEQPIKASREQRKRSGGSKGSQKSSKGGGKRIS